VQCACSFLFSEGPKRTLCVQKSWFKLATSDTPTAARTARAKPRARTLQRLLNRFLLTLMQRWQNLCSSRLAPWPTLRYRKGRRRTQKTGSLQKAAPSWWAAQLAARTGEALFSGQTSERSRANLLIPEKQRQNGTCTVLRACRLRVMLVELRLVTRIGAPLVRKEKKSGSAA